MTIASAIVSGLFLLLAAAVVARTDVGPGYFGGIYFK